MSQKKNLSDQTGKILPEENEGEHSKTLSNSCWNKKKMISIF